MSCLWTLARELIAGFGVDLSDGEGKGAKSEEEVKPEPSTGGAKLSQEEIERLMSGVPPPRRPRFLRERKAEPGGDRAADERRCSLRTAPRFLRQRKAESGGDRAADERNGSLCSSGGPTPAAEPQQSSARPYEAAGQYMPAPPEYAGEPRVINTKPVQLPAPGCGG